MPAVCEVADLNAQAVESLMKWELLEGTHDLRDDIWSLALRDVASAALDRVDFGIEFWQMPFRIDGRTLRQAL